MQRIPLTITLPFIAQARDHFDFDEMCHMVAGIANNQGIKSLDNPSKPIEIACLKLGHVGERYRGVMYSPTLLGRRMNRVTDQDIIYELVAEEFFNECQHQGRPNELNVQQFMTQWGREMMDFMEIDETKFKDAFLTLLARQQHAQLSDKVVGTDATSKSLRSKI